MTKRISGITIELDGDTTPLSKALKDLDGQLSKTQSSLKDVDRLLKFNPGNADLLNQKMGYLNAGISETEKRLASLTKAQDQMKASGIDQSSEAYQALQREIIETQSKHDHYNDVLQKTKTQLLAVQTASEAAAAGTKGAGEEAKDSSVNFLAMQEALSKAGEAAEKVGGALKGFGSKALDSFRAVDEGSDTIITKTGASGEALAEMDQQMRDIAESSVFSFAEAGTAIGEVSTRFGVTGSQLSELSTQFLEFAQITGTDVNSSIDSVQKAMASFGLSAEDAGAVMDAITAAGQASGVSIDKLTGNLVSSGAAFQGMGYSISDSIALLSMLEKSGVDSSEVLKGLKKVQQEAAASGQDMQTTLSQAFASSDSAAEIFGSKIGVDLYQRVQTGTLSLSDFAAGTTSLNDNLGLTAETFESTLDPIDQLAVAESRVQAIMAEVGGTIAEGLLPYLEKLQEIVGDVQAAWEGLSPEQQEAIVNIGLVTVAVADAAAGITKVAATIQAAQVVAGAMQGAIPGLVTAIGSIGSGAMSASQIVIAAVTSPVGMIVAGVAAAVAAGVLLYQNWDEISATVGTICDKISGFFQGMGAAIAGVAGAIVQPFQEAWSAISGIFSGEIHLPHIPLPHFSVTGSANPLSWLTEGVPHIAVDWYAKAMDQPYVFSSPAVIGVGEAGPETVVGEQWLKDHMSNNNNYITMNITTQPGQNSQEIAEVVISELTGRLRRGL